jgi:hypothetical protein
MHLQTTSLHGTPDLLYMHLQHERWQTFQVHASKPMVNSTWKVDTQPPGGAIMLYLIVELDSRQAAHNPLVKGTSSVCPAAALVQLQEQVVQSIHDTHDAHIYPSTVCAVM